MRNDVRFLNLNPKLQSILLKLLPGKWYIIFSYYKKMGKLVSLYMSEAW